MVAFSFARPCRPHCPRNTQAQEGSRRRRRCCSCCAAHGPRERTSRVYGVTGISIFVSPQFKPSLQHKKDGCPLKSAPQSFQGTLFDPILPLPPSHECMGTRRSSFSSCPSQLMLHLPCALRRNRYLTLERTQLPAGKPDPVSPAQCLHHRARCLPYWLWSAALRRIDANSTNWLEYHPPMAQETRLWQ